MTDNLPTPSDGAIHNNPTTKQRMVYNADQEVWESSALVQTSGSQMSGSIYYPDMEIGTLRHAITAVNNEDGAPPGAQPDQNLDFDFNSWMAVSDGGSNADWWDVAYGDGLFMAVDTRGAALAISSDGGVTWQTAGGPSGSTYAIGYGDGTWVIGTLQQTAFYSKNNGTTWNPASGFAGYAGGWNDIAYGNGMFVAVTSGGRAHRSTDGVNWQSVEIGAPFAYPNQSIEGITFGNGKFVAVGKKGTIGYSADGENWAASVGAPDAYLIRVTYGNGKFVAISVDGSQVIAHSSDGINWGAADTSTHVSETRIQFTGVAYGGGSFIAPCKQTTAGVLYSEDGVTWYEGQMPAIRSVHRGAAYGNGSFVVTSADSTTRMKVTGASSGGGGAAPHGGSGVFFDGREIQVDKGQRSALTTSANSVIKHIGSTRYYDNVRPSDSDGIEDGSLWLNPSDAKIHIYHDSDWNQLN